MDLRGRGPKVSVILPVYNGARHLEEAIRSVLGQRGVSFELLIGDDASTDESGRRIQACRRADPRVRAWRFRRRRGVAGNPNRIWPRARGEYLSIFEQDDVMLPGNLAELSRALDRSPRLGVVCRPRLILHESGAITPEDKFFPGRFPAWDLLRMQIPHAGTMVRKEAMRRVGGYQERLPVAADCDLFLRLAEVADVRQLPGRPLYLYRKWSGSETARPHSLREQRRVVQAILGQTLLRRYGVRGFCTSAPTGEHAGRRRTE